MFPEIEVYGCHMFLNESLGQGRVCGYAAQEPSLILFQTCAKEEWEVAQDFQLLYCQFIRFLGRAMLSTLHDTLRLIVTGIYARRDGKIFAAPHARTPSKPTKAEKFGTSI